MKCRQTMFSMQPVILLVTALLWVSAAGPADAQKKVENPHGKFKEDCSLCHSATGWKPAKISKKFDHEKYGIPLKGAHASVACMQCHNSLDFSTASAACIDCHADVHNNELGTDCSRCHGMRSFVDRNDQIRMHRLTRFPLAGAHETLDCEMCHRLQAPGSLSWVNTSTDCASCHMNDYNATTDPNHASSGFSTECAACHNEVSWNHTNFDHSQTGFPLTGAHRALSCDRCHVGGVFTGLSPACYSCHQQDYEGANNPDHSGFSTDCQTCHSTKGWEGANFDHSRTNFPLTGAHRTVACTECHASGVYSGLATACVSCHQQDYNGTTDPNHAQAGFSTDCTVCHTTTRWDGATFNHSQTAFPLTGAHNGAPCAGCHASGVYAGLPTDCYSCHQQDYQTANNPDHGGFPTDCAGCHGTASWSGADFNHSLTAFPLTGAHTTVACTNCHAGGVYSGLPTACVSCHQQDYNGTSNPNHAAANFTTDCTTCHNTTRWQGATFNHDQWFPIYTGKHSGKWQTCDDCHNNASNYAVFDCLSCHPHDNKTDTDNKHRGRNGYSYESNACYNCHPNGRA